MERTERQLRLIAVIYRAESVRQQGEALSQLRARCEALLDQTAPKVDGNARLRELLDSIRNEVRGLTHVPTTIPSTI